MKGFYFNLNREFFYFKKGKTEKKKLRDYLLRIFCKKFIHFFFLFLINKLVIFAKH